MASQVDFQATGFVILLTATREGAREEFLLPEVGPVVGEESTHCDERLLTAGIVALVGPLGLEVAALVRAELGMRGEALGAHFALEQALLLGFIMVFLE